MSIKFFFFFSSRRRHTRLTCDWSSDVCSSDLEILGARYHRKRHLHREQFADALAPPSDDRVSGGFRRRAAAADGEIFERSKAGVMAGRVSTKGGRKAT